MLAHCLRHGANISPVSGHCVVFGPTLNVGQRHRRRAIINLALVQSIVHALCSMRVRQHEILTRAEWILASTGDAGPTFNRHWVSVGLYSPLTVSTTKEVIELPWHYQTSVLLNVAPSNMRCWTSDSLMLGQCRRWWAGIGVSATPTQHKATIDFTADFRWPWQQLGDPPRGQSSQCLSFLNSDCTTAYTQQTQDLEPTLIYCWSSVVDGGPTLQQHWFNVSCFRVESPLSAM